MYPRRQIRLWFDEMVAEYFSDYYYFKVIFLSFHEEIRFWLSAHSNGGNTTKGEKLFKLRDNDVVGQVSVDWSQNEILKLLLLMRQ